MQIKLNQSEQETINKIAKYSQVSPGVVSQVIRGFLIATTFKMLEGKNIISIPFLGDFEFSYKKKDNPQTMKKDIIVEIINFNPTEIFKEEIDCIKNDKDTPTLQFFKDNIKDINAGILGIK